MQAGRANPQDSQQGVLLTGSGPHDRLPFLDRHASEEETGSSGGSESPKKGPTLDLSVVQTVPLEGNHDWMMEWETDSSHKMHLPVESGPPS